MKTLRSSFFLTVLASLLLLGQQWGISGSSSLAYASKTEPGSDEPDAGVAVYEPIKRKGGIGRVMDWGLAKLESIYDGALVSDLITAFVAKCDEMFAIMIHSFREMTLSYDELREREVERLDKFDVEFRDLVKLRQKIDRKCLYSSNADDRSLCVDKGIQIHDKIQGLRHQRERSAHSIDRYQDMIEWCASYNNWFC